MDCIRPFAGDGSLVQLEHMQRRPRHITLIAVLGMLVLGSCHPRTELASFDHCDRNPPDSVAPAPIAIRTSAESPGVVLVDARTSEGASSIIAVLDHQSVQARHGLSRFDGVAPGAHHLRVRSFGYGDRDTLVIVSSDSALYVTMTLSRGGGLAGCSSYTVEQPQ